MAVERRKYIHVLTGILVASMVAGCSDKKEPTASQAEADLKGDVTNLLKDINARDVHVTKNEMNAGGCQKEKSRYLYSITGTKKSPGGDDPNLLVDLMIGTLGDRYEIVDAHRGLPYWLKLHDKKIRTNLVVQSPEKSKIEITGSTDCLKLH